MANPAYDALKSRNRTIYNLEHVQSIVTWDRLTQMQPGSASARAAAQGELELMIQKLRTDHEVGDWIEAALSENLEHDDRVNLTLMRRERLMSEVLSPELIMRKSEATGAAYNAWVDARRANDWAAFVQPLDQVVSCMREEGERLGDALGIDAYDALLDRYDHGLRQSRVTELFDEIAGWLPAMISKIRERQAGLAVIAPVGPFPAQAQKRVGLAVMEHLGFNFNAGRLDVSAHPFMGGTSEDIRITTRYDENHCLSSVLAVVHETGHALYQGNLPEKWRGQPMGAPCSVAIHESQSLSMERQLAPRLGFARLIAPLLRAEFGVQPAFAPENLLRLMTRVQPGKIRVEADEVTYPAHVILRVEIEKALIGGEIAVADIPAWWDERMADLLGVDTRGDHAGGALQDIHWCQGMFGYFPSYLIGAMTAAQLFATFSDAHPQFGEAADRGAFGDYTGWLHDKVWSAGSRSTGEKLVEEVTGKRLSAAALKSHFEQRYLTS